jgi:hypothetical protein
MYTSVLTIHSWLRWVALVLAICATVNAYRDRSDSLERLPGKWWDTLFMAALDLQVLLGLALYFGLSPFTTEAMNNVGSVMRSPSLRFWAVEHLGAMAAAVVLVRVGRVMALTALTPASRRRRRLVSFALCSAVMIAGIPWPGLENGRPLFRGL